MKIRWKDKLIFISRLLGYLFNRKIVINERWNARNLNVPNKKTFGGYYDAKLVHKNQIIFHAYNAQDNRTVCPTSFDIVLYDLNTNLHIVIAKSNACNWQIGARLQWTDNGNIFFNSIENGNITSKLIKSDGEILKSFSNPFWYISEKFNLGATLNFSELAKYRPGYGYNGKQPNINKDEIRFVNLSNEQIIFATTAKDIGLKNPEGYYFNHIIANTDGTLFLTTLNKECVGKRFCVPVIIWPYEKQIKIYDTIKFPSHPQFVSKDEIIYFSSDGYVKHDLRNDVKVMLLKTNKDGHPTYTHTGDTFNIITDTYPDRFSRFSCYEFCSESGFSEIMSVRNPPIYRGAVRCDLHPRVINSNSLTIDCPTKSGREIFLLEKKL